MRDTPNLKSAPWRKSTYSNGQTNCIEVADDHFGVMPVRDSKDPHGPALVFEAAAWTAFVTSIKAGDFDA
ncbi:DUF397 domain-containing protein [Streptomyces sp. HSW2009]|uniref:DUF397 domain-containing protein n=1 Tax=Streptomyces sp. HSW2009 TaxID=3142890 RepID=UPI0032ED06BE